MEAETSPIDSTIPLLISKLFGLSIKAGKIIFKRK